MNDADILFSRNHIKETTMTQQQKPFPIPVSYFSISLGLLSLGLAWRTAAVRIGMPAPFGEIIILLGSLTWIFFIGVYLYKWLRRSDAAYTELQDLIQCCFISLVPITTILMGLGILPYSRSAALGFIAVGIAGCLLFAAYRSAGLWRGTHTFEATTPVVYLPTVAASYASAIALGTIGLTDWGMLFFGAGLFSWLGLESSILQRLRNAPALPAPLRPVMGIQLAPPFVGCAAYLSVNGGNIDWLVMLLTGYGLLNFIFLSRLLPWITEKGFFVSLWAFSFGLGSMATIGIKLYAATGETSIGILGLPLFWIGTALIALLALGTIHTILRGRFLIK
jgi:tellurite resistance protein